MRLEQPAELARRDVELEQAVGDVRVVVEVPGAARTTVASRAQESSVFGQRPEQELADAAGDLEPVVALEAVRGLGERRQREPVPGGEDLVVAEGLRCGSGARRAGGLRSAGSSSPRTMKRPCSKGSSSSRGIPADSASSSVQVYVSPSTPSVSAS